MELENYFGAYLKTVLKMDICQNYPPTYKLTNYLKYSTVLLRWENQSIGGERVIMSIIRNKYTKISTTNCVVKNKLHCYSRWCI